MQFAELKNRLLTTRDLRQNRLDDIIRVTDNTLLQLALNIPGEQKCPPGVGCLMQWANEQLRASFQHLLQLHEETDSLGPWAIYMTPVAAKDAKRRCCLIEQSHPFARLLDIDVYSTHGQSIDRQLLGIEQRCCLVCAEDAKECIRTQRHTGKMIDDCMQQLLESVPA